MKNVFISYRRQDTQAIAGRLFDGLEARLGDGAVFLDIDSIPPGSDFREHVRATLDRCGVLLVLIGTKWLEASVDGRRRLDDPHDLVRIEVESALEGGIPVVPVLVDQTRMPAPEQLPGKLSVLAYRNAVRLDSGIDFRNHLSRLVAGIAPYLEPAPPADTAGAATSAPTTALGEATALSSRAPAPPEPEPAFSQESSEDAARATADDATPQVQIAQTGVSPPEARASGMAARINSFAWHTVASRAQWATVVFTAAGLLVVYSLLSFRLTSTVEEAEAGLLSLSLPAPPATAAAPARSLDLADALSAEANDGLLNVSDLPGRTLVRIASDDLFGAGATIEPRFVPVLTRLADALNRLPGTVLVTGHTDNTPLGSNSPFKTKLELSEERARAVAKELVRSGVAADRLRAEGRSDGDPVVPNDTPDGRARNSRVDVMLYAPFAAPRRPTGQKKGGS
jgi:flagellar motor protein MotB